MMSRPRRAATLFSPNTGALPAVLIFCFTAQWAVADTTADAHKWLIGMSKALQSLSYEGVFVHRSDDQLTAMKVLHLAGEQGEYERLTTLTGELREIVHRSGYLAPGVQTVAGGGSRSGVVEALKEIANYYRLTLSDNDRVAGRPAQIIVITPRDDYRYGYRLWLDEATGLLLKSDLLALNGQVIEQVMFTSLSLRADEHRDDAEVVENIPVNGAAKDTPFPSHTPPEPPPGWTIGHVPEGFSLMMVQPVANGHNAHHMIYTDGLASVSVFVEVSPTSDDNSFVGISRMGAVSAFGELMNGHQVTVVGEVPETTVKMIGESIHYSGLD